jgi:hypothetical protein
LDYRKYLEATFIKSITNSTGIGNVTADPTFSNITGKEKDEKFRKVKKFLCAES